MKYSAVWLAVKLTGKAELTVSKWHFSTLLQGVKRTKAVDNYARKKAGLLPYPKLLWEKQQLSDTMVKVTFTLLYRLEL